MRFTYLDGIRGVAALLVLARHWNSFLGFDFAHSYLAVDIFFLLSGFVIAHAYDRKLQTGKLDATSFMAIRFARLYPIYAFALAICFVLALVRLAAKGAPSESFLEWVCAAVLAMGFLPFHVTGTVALFPLNICFWSLSMELGANAAYAYSRRLLNDLVLAGVVGVTGVTLAVLALRTGTADHGAFFTATSFVGGVVRCVFGIAAGLLLYRFRLALAPVARMVPPWLSFLIIAFVLTVPGSPWHPVLHDLLSIFILVPVAVIGAAAREPAEGWMSRSMVALGVASYPMYLLHVPVGTLLSKLTPWLGGYQMPVGLAAAAALFYASLQLDRHFDMPARTWLRERMMGPRRLTSA